ncbi:hypothetical protein NECID01_1490 [Nematocida sp. AWRm77]|nr:hypothetical protein NECID01_1490 [Nematocida sp. AWRm77]
MAGVNGYFNGKYVSKRERTIIFLVSAVTVLYSLASYIVYFTEANHLTINSPIVDVNKCLFISYMTSVVFNALILIEGFLGRNIIQIMLTTIVNLILFLSAGVSTLLYDVGDFSRYIYFGLVVGVSVFYIYILFLGFTLRKEFGWFYYKSYGADLDTNMVCSVRKTLSVLVRLSHEAIMSFWLFNSTFENSTIVAFGLVIYYVTIVIYIIESRYENYLLRIINIILCSLIVVYRIQSIVRFQIDLKPVFGEGGMADFRVPIIVQLSLKATLMFLYACFLTIDMFSFGKGFHGFYTQRQRQRACLD